MKSLREHKDKLVYLGRVISKHGIHIDLDKARLILEWSRPKNVRDVRRFIGVAQYEKRHIKDFSKIASPLIDLTKLDKQFIWMEKCQQAFDAIKDKVVENCIRKIPEMGKPFVVT